MDIIFLRDVTCECVIGVWPWEKKVTQKIILDIELGTDICKAAESDDLADTLNYQAITERIIEFAESTRFDLIETLIEKIAQLLMQEFGIKWLKIELNKGRAVKNVGSVGLVIERGDKN